MRGDDEMGLRGTLFLADKPSANIRSIPVDDALSPHLKFTSVFDNQLIMTVKGKGEATGPQGLEGFIFRPGQIDGGKGAAAKAVTLPAAQIIVHRSVQEDSLPGFPVPSERESCDKISHSLG
jgi:hypothetical protein